MTPLVSQRIRFSGRKPIARRSSRQAMPAAPAPLQTSLVVATSRPVSSKALISPAAAMIAENRHVEEFAQLLLDDETFRRLDVFQINSAPALAEQFDAIDELVGVLG